MKLPRKERDQKIIELWDSNTANQIAYQLEFKSCQGVYSAAERLGLKIKRAYLLKGEAQDNFIKENWSKLTSRQIAQSLGWNHRQSVDKRAKILGLPYRRGPYARVA